LLANLLKEPFASSKGDNVVVIGLGRFGSALARSLTQLGHDVMGIDKNAEQVQAWADHVTHAAQADSTSVNVMRQLGVADFSHAVVGIGSDLASSLMTVMVLTELGVKDIWVRAFTMEHGQIAQRIGAHHVVYPEAEMAERVAHLITGRTVDYLEFDDGSAIAMIYAPLPVHHRPLGDDGILGNFGVTVIGVKHANKDFQQATPLTVVLPGDLLIISGPIQKVAELAGRANT